jgi:thymidylate synthase
MNKFTSADIAFKHFYYQIKKNGLKLDNGTKALFNVGFIIENPIDNQIRTFWRKWSDRYAEREWKWYLSGDRSVKNIKKYAPIWDKMHTGDDIVNSNYGWQWKRNNQLEKVIKLLKEDKDTRRAWITIYDAKEIETYEKDTPCTLNVGFRIIENELCMQVIMRSNDLWFGFCNDQYCFSKLQVLVAKRLNLNVGWYYHFAADLHLYNKHLKL